MYKVSSRAIGVLGFRPFSHFLKTFANHITEFCDRCGENRFDLLMKYCVNPKIELCLDCLIHAKLFALLINSAFTSLGIENTAPFFEKALYRRTLKNAIRGIARFGVKRPFVTGAPVAVVWNFTNQCNLKCSHCYADSSNSPSDSELSTKECHEVVDKLVEADVAALNFGGGEPLLRKDFFEVANYANQQKLYLTLSTNGTLLTRENVMKLIDAGVVSVNISLDGATPETHERIRNVKGCFDLAVKGIRNAVKYGKFTDVIVNTTLTKFTMNEIPRTYEFVKDLGANRFYVSRILPTGRGKDFMKYDVTPREKIEVLNFLYEKFRGAVKGKKEIVALTRGMTYYSKVCYERSCGTILPACEILTGFEKTHSDNFGNHLSNVTAGIGEFLSGCATGLFYCGLSPEGDVLPCAPATSLKLGNLLNDNLEDIWLNHPLLNNIRKRNKINGKCSKCNAKDYCGGCRLTSFGTTGDWLASDPTCPFEQKH